MTARVALLCLAVTTPLVAQTPPALRTVTFDVVSIKRHQQEAGPGFRSSQIERPDGGVTLMNLPVALFITRAYPPVGPANMVNLPAWAMSDRYDLSATASLERPTAEDRAAMMRALLAERFKFAAHFEKREQDTFDLVVARRDGTLGRGLTPIETDCATGAAERSAAATAKMLADPLQILDFKAPLPPCQFRVVGPQVRADRQGALGSLLEGEGTMEGLAPLLRMSAGRPVNDRTGIIGSFRVAMNFEGVFERRGPAVEPAPDAPPSVFVALQEQLGLKLEPSKTMVDTLIIDRLERPTEN